LNSNNYNDVKIFGLFW